MLTHPTLDRLHALGLHGMASASAGGGPMPESSLAARAASIAQPSNRSDRTVSNVARIKNCRAAACVHYLCTWTVCFCTWTAAP